jgi:CDP-diacylglycerol--glycerol-3-phosphate 3-phosphatidyltransferase
MTLADKFTLARLFLAPLAAIAYLFLPVEYNLCFWACGLLAASSEITDWLDGQVARARKEVSDFGKLADPFCDVFYRIFLFMVFLLPAGGSAYQGIDLPDGVLMDLVLPLEFDRADGAVVIGIAPFLPVLLMTLREIIAGALRSMAATKGLVLAARMSGKVKAWFQGTAIITAMGLPAFFGGPAAWHVWVNTGLIWFAALLRAYSIIEYLIVNRTVLAQLAQRRSLE